VEIMRVLLGPVPQACTLLADDPERSARLLTDVIRHGRDPDRRPECVRLLCRYGASAAHVDLAPLTYDAINLHTVNATIELVRCGADIFGVPDNLIRRHIIGKLGGRDGVLRAQADFAAGRVPGSRTKAIR
jgi:hypothetical protein